MILLKIFFEFCIIATQILFALPDDSMIFSFKFIKTNREQIFDYLIWVLFISIVGRYIIEYNLFKYKKENVKLLEAAKAYRSFLSGYIDEKLKQIFDTLNCKETERISVFLYSSTLNKFFSIGRYSLSPKYNKVGRYIIENEDEYVYAVLNDNLHYDSSPSIDNHRFSLKRNKRVMESNDMYGVALFDKNKQDKIGVVILQSMKKESYKNTRTRKKIAKQVENLNNEINKMNIEPNAIVSTNNTVEGL